MARIKFRTTCVTSSHGSFETGDMLTCSDAFAAHLVNDCGAAEFVDDVKADLSDCPVDPRIEESVGAMEELPKRRCRPAKAA